MTAPHKNHLASETSPYLLQHASNPVDWYPWGEKAFDKARKETKPVLLSIGYSACHWCHVMAHESFEELSIAQFMNSHFINIKVDREEYPDIDHLYQTFVQLTTGRGGWPLTVFLTPEKIPFFGGTYFPATPRYGMISFPDLLQRISDIYQNEPQKISKNSIEILSLFEKMEKTTLIDQLPDFQKSFDNLFRALENSYDSVHGGFSKAPKFPQVSDMEFLLSYYHYTGLKKAKDMVLHTLNKMACGGIFDQLGGGFHRYSTDEKWLVPHFEKMLYDNALLISIFSDAYRISRKEVYREVGQETANFVLRELCAPNGAFYASLDADSEGEEGKYYVWDYDEIQSCLEDDTSSLFCEYYQITKNGNFEGKNIPQIVRSLDTLAPNFGLSTQQAQEKIKMARKILLNKRETRIPPTLDNKILTDWNGMMISALWKLYESSGIIKYRQAAEQALHYFLKTHVEESGQVYHFIRKDHSKIDGYIDDYAYFVSALIDGFEVTQNTQFLQVAHRISQYALQNFWDHEAGGFYFTHRERDAVIIRLKQIFDSSTPSGNNMMAMNLLRLHAYTGENHFLQRVERMFQLHQKELELRGMALSKLVIALLWYAKSPLEITISLPPEKSSSKLIPQISGLYLPFRVMLEVGNNPLNDIISPELIRNRKTDDQEAIFVCHRGTCSLPLFDVDQFFDTIHSLNLYIK